MSDPRSTVTFRYKGQTIFVKEFNSIVSMSDFTGTIEILGTVEEEKCQN